MQLRIPTGTLLRIEEDYQKTQDRFTRMLEEWVNGPLKPTKEDLVAALRSNTLRENRLADQVERWTPLSSPQQGEYCSWCYQISSVIVYYYYQILVLGQQGTSVSDHSRSCGPANRKITRMCAPTT